MNFNKDPKDPKKSIRLKYNRRREFLRHSLEQFILFAEERLNEDKYGKIYRKEEVEILLKGALDFLNTFPQINEYEFTTEDFDNFNIVLEEATKETEKLLDNIENNNSKYLDSLRQIYEDIEKLKK